MSLIASAMMILAIVPERWRVPIAIVFFFLFVKLFKGSARKGTITTKLVTNAHDLIDCTTELLSCQVLALDCEGVDLGRCGELSIIQISSRNNRCYIFDVLKLDKTSHVVLFLKKLLENQNIVKIVHDVRMDSDALYHCLGIRLHNVHDTQAWDKVIHGREDNLNMTLLRNKCTPNEERDRNVYRVNNRFWAERPITQTMIDWASGDVKCLFDLYDAQMNHVATRCWIRGWKVKSKCVDASNNRLTLRDKIHQIYQIRTDNVGRFIGTGGQNIRKLCDEVPGSYYQITHQGNRGKKCDICVYADNKAAMNQALQQMKQYA